MFLGRVRVMDYSEYASARLGVGVLPSPFDLLRGFFRVSPVVVVS